MLSYVGIFYHSRKKNIANCIDFVDDIIVFNSLAVHNWHGNNNEGSGRVFYSAACCTRASTRKLQTINVKRIVSDQIHTLYNLDNTKLVYWFVTRSDLCCRQTVSGQFSPFSQDHKTNSSCCNEPVQEIVSYKINNMYKCITAFTGPNVRRRIITKNTNVITYNR